MNTPEFFAAAACREVSHDLFVGPLDESRDAAQARRRLALTICNGGEVDAELRPPCPVRAECLEYARSEALTVGVFGGLSARSRRPLGRGKAPVEVEPTPVPEVDAALPERTLSLVAGRSLTLPSLDPAATVERARRANEAAQAAQAAQAAASGSAA